jgi:hypothetical protein
MFKGFIILIKDKFQTLESESVSLEELKKTGSGSENITIMSITWQRKTTP